MRKRADIVLVERGVFASRARAQEAIAAGLVRVGGVVVRKASEAIDEAAAIEAEAPHPVRLARRVEARGRARRLRASIPPGSPASTSAPRPAASPTCCCRAARECVVAVDVGHGQFDPRLAADPRVRSLEGLRRARLTVDLLGEPPGAIVCDVSFISQRLVLPHVLALAARPALARQPRQAAVRGRPRRDRQGRGQRRGGARARLRRRPRAASRRWAGRASASIPSPVLGGDGRAANSCMPRGMDESVEIWRSSASNARGEGVADDGASCPAPCPAKARVRIGGGEPS